MVDLIPTFLIIAALLGICVGLGATQIIRGTIGERVVYSIWAGIAGFAVSFVVIVIIWVMIDNCLLILLLLALLTLLAFATR